MLTGIHGQLHREQLGAVVLDAICPVTDRLDENDFHLDDLSRVQLVHSSIDRSQCYVEFDPAILEALFADAI